MRLMEGNKENKFRVLPLLSVHDNRAQFYTKRQRTFEKRIWETQRLACWVVITIPGKFYVGVNVFKQTEKEARKREDNVHNDKNQSWTNLKLVDQSNDFSME